MSHDRPLDDLLPELAGVGPISGMEQGPIVHPSVLQVELEGGYEWLYAIWKQPNAEQVLGEFRKLLKVTQMVAACDVEAPRRNFTNARLALFEVPNRDVSKALAHLTFAPVPFSAEEYVGRMLILAEEATSAGWQIPGKPASVWSAPVLTPAAELKQIMEVLDLSLTEQFAENKWGLQPGQPSKTMAEQIRYHFGVEIEPTFEGLKTIGLLLLDHRSNGLRWVPSGVFLAICDFIGVVIQNSKGWEVGWATPAKVGNFPAPPSLQVKAPGETFVLPIASLLVEWAVMPHLSSAPTMLSESLEDALRNR